jgi:hypothetical protein
MIEDLSFPFLPNPTVAAVWTTLSKILRLIPHDLIEQFAILIGVVVCVDDVPLRLRSWLSPKTQLSQRLDYRTLRAAGVTMNQGLAIDGSNAEAGIGIVVCRA